MLELSLNLQRQNLINRLWQDIKANLNEDGNLSPVAFLSISAAWEFPKNFEVTVNDQTFYCLTSAGDSEDYQLLIILLNFDNKSLSVGLVQKFVTEFNADFVIIVTEAWIVQKPEREIELDPQKAFLIPPRLDPDRQEVLLISFQNRLGTWQSFNPIKRDKMGNPHLRQTFEDFTFFEEMMGSFNLNFVEVN